jgi:hypothetical protein
MGKRESNPPPPAGASRPAAPPAPPATAPELAPGKMLPGASFAAPGARTIFERLIAIKAEIQPIAKKPAQDLPYPVRRLEDIYQELKDLTARHGVISAPEVVDLQTEERETVNRHGETKVLIYRVVTVDFHFYGLAGDQLPRPIRVVGEAMDFGDNAVQKAISSADKTCLLTLFEIPTAPGPDRAAGSEATGRAGGGGGAGRQWRENDRYRYGKGKGQPLTEGSLDYLIRYGVEIRRDIDRGKPWATVDHLASIQAEIARRSSKTGRESAAAGGRAEGPGPGGAPEKGADTAREPGQDEPGPDECPACGCEVVENGVCEHCGLVIDDDPGCFPNPD